MIPNQCSSVSHFQFATVAFLCTIYLPYTFHSTIWTLYIQPISSGNCSFKFTSNSTTISYWFNRSECCPCEEYLDKDQQLHRTCQLWYEQFQGFERQKINLLDEWHLLCQTDHRLKLLRGSLTFSLGEILGVLILALLADRYGRKLILLISLYIPVLFGSLASFTTNYLLFLILRWPVGFFNKALLIVVFLMVIESSEYKTRAQIGSLLLASIPVFGILIGTAYFFVLDWRYLQLFGSLITTLSLCYPWLIPESRRWYVNSHRVSRVNKLFQNSSWNKITSVQTSPSTIYDKPVVCQESAHIQIGSYSSLIFNGQLRTITACLTILWLSLSFSYHLTSFPVLIIHPIMNHVAMNATEFLAYLAGFFIAPRIGRRVPLAVLILIAGLSSISLAITFLGTGHQWLEINFTLMIRLCLKISYCLLVLFTVELYPTSIRATGFAIGVSSEIVAKMAVELLFFFSVDRTLVLFVAGGILCLTCFLLLPLPETLLYDLPDSLTDLQSMRPSVAKEENKKCLNSHYHMIDANTASCPRVNPMNTITSTSDLNDILSLSPQTIVSSIPAEEQIQPLSTTNLCYFASVQDTIDQQQHVDNHLMIALRSAQHSGNQSRIENTKL